MMWGVGPTSYFLFFETYIVFMYRASMFKNIGVTTNLYTLSKGRLTSMPRGVMNNAADIEKRCREVNPLSLTGMSAMAFPEKISTTRGGMMVKHVSQRLVVRKPEFPMLFSGAENEFGKRSSWDVRATADYRLMKKFVKFPNAPYSPIAYIFQNVENGKFLCKIYNPAVNLVEKYGFRMHNNIPNIQEGDLLPKGSSIAQSSSYVDDNYCAGVNVRMAYAVLPELTEDSLIISDECAKSLEYDFVDTVTVNVSKKSFLLNRYGRNGEYKPFPNIGEEVQDDILCSIRENSYVSSVAEASIPHINDTKIFSHGIVADIDIFTNVDVENDQFNYYLSQIKQWYSDIYAYISTVIADPYQDDTSLLDIYHQAEKYLNSSTWVTKEYIADTIIKFTMLQPMKIKVGQKVVGRYGNKSVISKIVPVDEMPKTDDGRPIDMLANALAVPNRIIAFATYEGSMTFMMDRMNQHIAKMHAEGCPDSEFVRIASDFVSIFNPDQGSEINRLFALNPSAVAEDILTNGIHIQIKPFNEVCVRDAILEAYEKYPAIMRHYKVYTKLHKRWIELDEAYPVGFQYTWVLKQEPSKALSAISTGRTTLYDQPVKTHQYNKNLRHYSDNPVKFGEYDTYNLLAGIGAIDFAKITTYYRGSQYEENSILMAQLNDMGINFDRYNQFPQLDNLKNSLKFMGIKLRPDIFGYSTIGTIDKLYDVLINNVQIQVSIPELREFLIMYSYFMKYQQVHPFVDLEEFFKVIDETDLFEGSDRDYIESMYERFTRLLPTLDQLKQYC